MIDDVATIVAPHSTMLTDRRSTSFGMRRSKASMSSTPRASATAAKNSTASVVTLMPPAVDAEPPPTNMSMSSTSSVEPFISPMSIVLRPPERDMIEVNIAVMGRVRPSCPPSVALFDHSSRAIASPPTAMRMTVVRSVTRACRVRRERKRNQRPRAKMTGKPMAPRNTAIESTESIHGSEAKRSMPGAKGTNPVFVKAESER